MSRVPCACICLLLAITVQGLAQQATKTEGTTITGPHTAFSVVLPNGWQSAAYDNLADKPNAQNIRQMLSLPEDFRNTDNMSFWWDPAGEKPESGMASLHRFEGQNELDADGLLALVQRGGGLPQGVQMSVTKVGRYEAAIGGGTMQNGLYGGFVLIPAGTASYVGTILGPQAAIAPQWSNFMALLASLEAPDLTPVVAGRTTPSSLGWGPDDQAYPDRAWVNPQDGSEMVWVPAGEFTMGSPKGEGMSNEHPQHTVMLSAYWIGKTEVTNEQYGKFLEYMKRTGDHSKCFKGEPANKDHTAHYGTGVTLTGAKQPAVGVDWYDAYAYAAWAGKRLPTEAEWEKAGRGTAGRKYPWGNEWDKSKCNSHDGGKGVSVDVGSYPEGQSPYGCLDMAGNVWEWCTDWYNAFYYSASPMKDPQGPGTGEFGLLRGGSGESNYETCRAAFRLQFYRSNHDFNNGFRVARTP